MARSVGLLLATICTFLPHGSARESAKARWLASTRAMIKEHGGAVYTQNIPSAALLSKHPAVLQEGLIMARETPALSHHSSSVVELPSGGLMAAWFAGTYEGEQDVGIWVSVLEPNSTSWRSPMEVVQPHGEPCWNPVLFYHKASSHLMLFYKVGAAPTHWRGYLKRSTDSGETWEDAVLLPLPIVGPSKNKPIELQDGTIVVGASDETGASGEDWSVWVERSSDGGRGWERIGPIKRSMRSMIQPALFTDREGKLRMVLRTKKQVLGLVVGDEEGRRWSPARLLSNVLNPNSGVDAVTLHDGRVVMVYNRSQKRGIAGRTTLDLAVSNDSGETWKHVLNLEAAPHSRKEFSYPAIIQGSDGVLHVTYTWGRHNIKYVRLAPHRLVPQSVLGGQVPEGGL